MARRDELLAKAEARLAELDEALRPGQPQTRRRKTTADDAQHAIRRERDSMIATIEDLRAGVLSPAVISFVKAGER